MEAQLPARRHYLVTLALLTVAGVSFALMQTLVIPALPFFQREFGTVRELGDLDRDGASCSAPPC